MDDLVGKRAVEIGRYIADNKCTVRAAAKKLGISKSTVHKDISERLKDIDSLLYEQAEQVLQFNKAQRHIRGGNATKKKYEQVRNMKKNLAKS